LAQSSDFSVLLKAGAPDAMMDSYEDWKKQNSQAAPQESADDQRICGRRLGNDSLDGPAVFRPIRNPPRFPRPIFTVRKLAAF
jgi:hypothetical protein